VNYIIQNMTKLKKLNHKLYFHKSYHSCKDFWVIVGCRHCAHLFEINTNLIFRVRRWRTNAERRGHAEPYPWTTRAVAEIEIAPKITCQELVIKDVLL